MSDVEYELDRAKRELQDQIWALERKLKQVEQRLARVEERLGNLEAYHE